MWWRIFFVALFLGFGSMFWVYSGCQALMDARAEILEKGWVYHGNIILTDSEYHNLKLDLSKRSVHLQRSHDLTINNIAEDGSTDLSYDFLSVADYPTLTKSKPGGAYASSVAMAQVLRFVYFLFLPLISISILQRRKQRSEQEKANSTTVSP